MNFVIHTSQDKQTLYNYLKELESGYIVKVSKQKNKSKFNKSSKKW